MAKAITDEERAVRRRISAIEKRLSDLSDLWDYAASSDVEYRMIEAEQQALRQERTTLQEILGDL